MFREPSAQSDNVQTTEPTNNPSLTPDYTPALKPQSNPSLPPSLPPSEPRSTKSWENNVENRKMKMDSTSHYLRYYFRNGIESLPQAPILEFLELCNLTV